LPRGAVENKAFKVIYELCRYDVIPTDFLFDTLIGFNDHEPLSPRFEEMGYESQFFIFNLGSYYLLFICTLVLFVVLKALLFVERKKP
jgi:hypothetical protein